MTMLLVAGCADATGTAEFPHADDVPRLVAQEDLRIGSLDDPNEGFSRIVGVAVGPDRRIYVAEGQDAHLRVYDPSGRLERVVGGQGEGPGEFRFISRLGLLGDTLWAVDPGNARITLFDREGELLGTVRAPAVSHTVPGQTVRLMPSRLLPDRRWMSETATMMFEVGAEGVSIFVPELLFDESGAVTDTLREVRFVWPPMWVVADSVRIPAEHLLPMDPLIAHMPDGTVVVDRSAAPSAIEGTFTVVRTDVAGDTLFALRFRYDPRPLDPEYVGRAVEALLGGQQGDLGAERIGHALRSVLPVFHPPVSQLWLGEDGSIWLRRQDDDTHEWRYLVIEPDGTVRGELSVPRRTSLAWTGGDELIAVELDAFDVPWLVRYRVR